MKNKLNLSPPLKHIFYVVFISLFITGVFWIILKYTALASRYWGWVPIWLMKVHGLLAMGALIVLGWMIPTHFLLGWTKKKHRASGALMIVICTILILSGYGLYYFGNEPLRTLTDFTHIGVGILFPVILIGHIWSGRKK